MTLTDRIILLEAALAPLGTTVDAVADNLDKLGIKGKEACLDVIALVR